MFLCCLACSYILQILSAIVAVYAPLYLACRNLQFTLSAALLGFVILSSHLAPCSTYGTSTNGETKMHLHQ